MRWYPVVSSVLTVFATSVLPECADHSFHSQCFYGTRGCPCMDDGVCYDDLVCSDKGICTPPVPTGSDTDRGGPDDVDSSTSTDTEDAGLSHDSDTAANDAGDAGTDKDAGDAGGQSDGGTEIGSGAYATGVYRNLFAEIGKSESDIQAKIDEAWDHFFFGDDNQRVYYPEGDMAYILDTGHNDVRSEGMSYGMMIAVQMNKKEEFDKIWNWAVIHMYYDDGEYAGWLGWQNATTGERIDGEQSPASDGEEYIAMALFFASHRWGDGDGVYNYSQEANKILHAMLHQADDGVGVNMFDGVSNLVVFCPVGSYAKFTNPSYVLPGFYHLFAEWADQDNDRWREIADAGRAFLHQSTHGTTGLNPDYARFDGSAYDPAGNGHEHFKQDAWRVAINIGFDYAWFEADPWQTTFAETIQGFFYGIGINSYGSQYQLDGTVLDGSPGIGLIAANAVPGLATDSEPSAAFVEALWNLTPPSGPWRYYDGLIYFLSTLHAAGEFKIWKP